MGSYLPPLHLPISLTISKHQVHKSPQNHTPIPSTTTKMVVKKKEKKQYWLLKTEPGEWSWEDQASNHGLSNWDGVKNNQAKNNMKSMKLNDLCFFYHSGTKSRCVVGVVSVAREWYADEKDNGVVDVKAVGEMRRHVDLKEMKKDGGLKGFELFRQPRLSVVKVEERVWERVCEIGGGYEGDGNEDV